MAQYCVSSLVVVSTASRVMTAFSLGLEYFEGEEMALKNHEATNTKEQEVTKRLLSTLFLCCGAPLSQSIIHGLQTLS